MNAPAEDPRGGEVVTMPCPRDSSPCAVICGSRGVCGALAVRQHPARPAGDRAQPTQELREAIARWLFRKVIRRDGLTKLAFEHLERPQVTGWLEWADELLAGPLAALLDAQAAVGRVEAAINRHADNLTPTQRAAFARALNRTT